MGQQSFEKTLGDNEGKPGMLPFIGAQEWDTTEHLNNPANAL